jgi:cell division protein FtsN
MIAGAAIAIVILGVFAARIATKRPSHAKTPTSEVSAPSGAAPATEPVTSTAAIPGSSAPGRGEVSAPPPPTPAPQVSQQSQIAPGSIAAIQPMAPVSSSGAGAGAKNSASSSRTSKPATAAAGGSDVAATPAGRVTYGIAVATYLDANKAEAERAKLSASTGLPAQVRGVMDGGETTYQIVIGSFPSRAAAENAASDLVRKSLIEEARLVQTGPAKN